MRIHHQNIVTYTFNDVVFVPQASIRNQFHKFIEKIKIVNNLSLSLLSIILQRAPLYINLFSNTILIFSYFFKPNNL